MDSEGTHLSKSRGVRTFYIVVRGLCGILGLWVGRNLPAGWQSHFSNAIGVSLVALSVLALIANLRLRTSAPQSPPAETMDQATRTSPPPKLLARLYEATGMLLYAQMPLYCVQTGDGWKFAAAVSLAAFLVLMTLVGLLGGLD